MVGLWYWRKLRDTREASNGGRVRVRIIPGTTRNVSTCDLDYWSLKGHCFSFATFL